VKTEIADAEMRGAVSDGMNRKMRRAAAKMDRQQDRRQGVKA
jgi:hypothetical protein